ncbi:hypothetical protein [Glycomyces xiaoerkulensis]|uniref:hypothetical protein n=1 Tax=Glycomyces xiaoerkulensis TaxID=2038139 RepID=UPI000C259850|nr:hypothetical protein [Glycomyces xiaoerkulensis]
MLSALVQTAGTVIAAFITPLLTVWLSRKALRGGDSSRPWSRGKVALVLAAPATAVTVTIALAAGYFIGGGFDDRGPLITPSETEARGPTADPTSNSECDPDRFEIPAGYLGVASLCALTRAPEQLAECAPPGGATALAVDAHTFCYEDEEGHYSELTVGVWDVSGVVLDPDDLEGTAEATVAAWADTADFEHASGLEIDWTSTRATPFDVDKTGVMSAAGFEWDGSTRTDDTFAVVQVVIVELDRSTAWIGLMNLAGSHFDEFLDPVGAAMVNTTFAE